MVKEDKKKQVRLSQVIKNYIKSQNIDYRFNKELNYYMFGSEGESHRIYDVVMIFSDEENWVRIMLCSPSDLPPSYENDILRVLNNFSLQEIFGCLALQPMGMLITNSLYINTELFCPDKDFFDITIDDLADELDMVLDEVEKIPRNEKAHLFSPLTPFGSDNDNMEN